MSTEMLTTQKNVSVYRFATAPFTAIEETLFVLTNEIYDIGKR